MSVYDAVVFTPALHLFPEINCRAEISHRINVWLPAWTTCRRISGEKTKYLQRSNLIWHWPKYLVHSNYCAQSATRFRLGCADSTVMKTGGRLIYHLQRYAPSDKNTGVITISLHVWAVISYICAVMKPSLGSDKTGFYSLQYKETLNKRWYIEIELRCEVFHYGRAISCEPPPSFSPLGSIKNDIF